MVTATHLPLEVPVVTLRPTGALRRRQRVEKVIKAALFVTAAMSVVTTALIILSLLSPAGDFFAEVSPATFFGGTQWFPNFTPPDFGVWGIVTGTLMVTFIAI